MIRQREFTFSALLLGVLIGVVFGAANAYLGLKVGMTVSASIPAAVISMGILRGLLKRGTVLENNMVQTIGSAGESLAAGVVFTVPALFILGMAPSYLEITLWGAIGGLLGVFLMIPLRSYLIVREHGRLTYPEGVACAEVLEAGEYGGQMAKTVFWGLGLSGLYQAARGLGFWPNTAGVALPRLRSAATLDASPALLGVGFIIGPRIAAYMLSGAALGWFVIIPAIAFFGAAPFGPVLDEATVNGPVILDQPRQSQVYFTNPGGGPGTVLLSFPIPESLATNDRGLAITAPQEWDLADAVIGGIAAGENTYDCTATFVDGRLNLTKLSPPLFKIANRIDAGWVAVVLHGVRRTSTREAPAWMIQLTRGNATDSEPIQVSPTITSRGGATLYVNERAPGATQVTGILTMPVERRHDGPRRFLLDVGRWLENSQGRSNVVDAPHVISFYDGSIVRTAVAVPVDATTDGLAGQLALDGIDPPFADVPLEAGWVTITLHNLVNPIAGVTPAAFGVQTLAAPTALFPATTPIATMTPDDIHTHYVKYVGAGAVAIGGLLSLVKSLPIICVSIWSALGGVFSRRSREPTQRDIPFLLVVLGVAGLAAAMWQLPMVRTGWLGAVLVCVFGFLFVTVSSRLVGQVGSSSNPISGMTIATLLGAALIFFAMGETGDVGKMTALSVGALVCIAISVAGDCSQDLKTGYLVKATPWKQQAGEMVGVLTSAVCIAGALYLLDQGYGFTDDRPNALNAPQARLMALLLQGVFDQNLPWLFIFIGIAAGLVVELLGIGCLPFAVGLYLPLELSTPIMVGGLLRWIVDHLRRRSAEGSEHNPGILGASGFVAGEGLLGIGLAGAAAVGTWLWPERDIDCVELAPWALAQVNVDSHYGLSERGWSLLPLVPFAVVTVWLFFTALRAPIKPPPPPLPMPNRPDSPGGEGESLLDRARERGAVTPLSVTATEQATRQPPPVHLPPPPGE